jgi:hypothetical protein
MYIFSPKNLAHATWRKIVKLGQGQEVEVDGKKKCYNITNLRKNARESKRRKPGRKRPRPHDEDEQDDQEDEPMEQEEEPAEPIDEAADLENVIDLDMPPENEENEIERDIAYSRDVWVLHEAGKLSVDLNVTEREIIESKREDGWLNDVIIDASMQLLLNNKNHKNIGIYQSCNLARDATFRRQVGPWSVIVNTDLVGNGEHWVLFSSVGAKPDHVIMYDSAPTGKFTSQLKMAVASIANIKGNKMFIDLVDVHRQDNCKDCGVIAIANMTALAYNLDPKSKKYAKSGLLRSHLKYCLEEKVFLPFPTIGERRSRGTVNERIIELFCTCKLPKQKIISNVINVNNGSTPNVTVWMAI